MNKIPENKPRIGKHSDKQGSYEQCFKLITPVINPGETIVVEQYFTGYGEIDSAKICFYPSAEIFDSERSYITNGVKEENGKIMYGRERQHYLDTGIVVHMRGIEKPLWDSDTQFFDITDNDLPQIFTETKSVEAPFKYELKTRKTIKAGNYSLEFVFTYFNGQQWVTSTKSIVFKVQNFLERYAIQIGTVAILVSISALARFVVIPLYDLLAQLWEKLWLLGIY